MSEPRHYPVIEDPSQSDSEKGSAPRPKPESGPKGWYAAFIAVTLAFLAIPLVAMPFAPVDEEAELQVLAETPQLVLDGHPNVGVLADAGTWFDDHFAFRQQLITANAWIETSIFGVSPTDQVVDGTDGWLYYGGTLSDYQRMGTLSDRGMENAAYNLALMNGYVKSRNARMLVVTPPNKNLLYPEHMPYYELPGEGPTSATRLGEALRDMDVATVDLQSLFEKQDEVLYQKTDSHWNARGALLAYNAMMDELDIPHETYAGSGGTWDETFVGDLEAMLYPLNRTPEPLEVVDGSRNFEYLTDQTDVEDDYLVTRSTAPHASDLKLLMYRDSFGNSLLPFFATGFSEAVFTKLVPYDLARLDSVGADVVIVERTERHIASFATDPPAFAAPTVRPPERLEELANTANVYEDDRFSAMPNGSFMEIQGSLSAEAFREAFDGAGELLIRISWNGGDEGFFCRPFRTTFIDEETGAYNDWGYRLYVRDTSLPATGIGVDVVVASDTTGIILDAEYFSMERD